MEDIKLKLKNKAIEEHGIIYPCGKNTWDECYTFDADSILFWFNTENRTTKVLRHKRPIYSLIFNDEKAPHETPQESST